MSFSSFSYPKAISALAVLVIVGVAGWWQFSSRPPNPVPDKNKETKSQKMQVCPSEWYVNRMPQATPEGEKPKPPENRQYFIVDGQRVEYEQMDVEWVKENCEVSEPAPVY